MTRDDAQPPQKKVYTTPRMVDLGAIEIMTGDCIGLCADGLNGARFGSAPLL